MILLQETELTFSFVPIGSCGPSPWYERLFALYLFFMLLVLAARGTQLVWHLNCLRRLQRQGDGSRFHDLSLAIHTLADSLKRFSVLTFVLVLADISLAAADMLTQIGTQKISGTLWLSLDAAQQLRITAFGLLLCAALYAAAFFFQARLARRERAFAEQTGANPPQSPAAPTSL